MSITIFGYTFGKANLPVDMGMEITDHIEESKGPESNGHSFSGSNGGGGMMISSMGYIAIGGTSFNGEKTPGELGLPSNFVVDHAMLRARSYDANLTNVIVRIIFKKFIKWVIGPGLKIQAEPVEDILKLEKINFDHKAFTSNVEAYYTLWADSKESDYAGMCNLHENAGKHFETKFLGGDVLTVLRLDDDMNPTVQVIDAQHVRQPLMNGNWIDEAKARGNYILRGIEIDPKGTHVAYYVVKQSLSNMLGDWERIEARGKESGLLMAWMSYSSKQRIDHHRGIPEITAILETLEKMDRYTEATVSSAEERAKITVAVEHDRNSDGENPFGAKVKESAGMIASINNSYMLGKEVAKNIETTSNRQAINMPIGSKLTTVTSTGEINYPAFFEAIFMQLCAAMDIPPEVALQKYSSNFSASRAAINGWGFLINIYRVKEARDFNDPIYAFWLYVHVLKSKVDADGYIKAVQDKNMYVVNSYNKARFTGSNMPHIDPLKEANAIRVMLGDKTTPLITYEQATELLNNGEWSENIKKNKAEREDIPDLLPGQVPGVDEEDDESEEPEDDEVTHTKKVKNATDK